MSDDLVGQTIGEFKIVNLLGRGGMGSVYEAIEEPAGKTVALKIPHEKYLQQEEYLQRFTDEAKTAQQVQHPNIVTTYGVEQRGEYRFIVMEYVYGRQLSMAIKHAVKMETDEALEIGRQIASGLQAIHESHILHRDIKPQNILLGEDGRARIMDFGIAKARQKGRVPGESDPEEEKDEDWLGTLLYLSPEQCKKQRLDHRTDLYSLSVILFEMLAGRPPFHDQDPLELMRMITEDPPPSVRSLNPTVPESMQDFFDTGLEKDPEERFGSAAELRRELETVLHDIGATLAVLPINLPSQPEKPATPEPAEEEQKSELPFSGTLDRLKGLFRQE